MSKRGSITIMSLFLLLIVFDAMQQKYYIDTFDLASEPVTLLALLKNHLIRWVLWMVPAIPIGFLLWKSFNNKQGQIEMTQTLKVSGIFVLGVLAALVLVTLQVLWVQLLPLTWEVFGEIYLFFVFQKGLTFFLAYGALAMILLDLIRNRMLIEQQAELLFLKAKDKADNKKDNPIPFLQVKTGHQLKTLSLEEIVWIQADDYCVKVHTTDDRSYTIRQSMKYLEDQLAPYRFLRVHRSALLNLQFLEHINTSKSTITLNNQSEIAASKSGIRSLKKELEASTL
jgi:hypothetical protein